MICNKIIRGKMGSQDINVEKEISNVEQEDYSPTGELKCFDGKPIYFLEPKIVATTTTIIGIQKASLSPQEFFELMSHLKEKG